MEHYQVKFTDANGRVYYGIYRGPVKGKKGYCTVDDAVIPQPWCVPESMLVDIPLGDYENSEYNKFVNKEYEKARKLSKSLGAGLKVGKLFDTSVADGRAYYVVTKVGKKNVTVEWRGFCLDRYTEQVLGWGGSFPAHVIERMVGMQDALAKIFGNH